MKKIIDFGQKIENFVMAATFIVMSLAAFAQVVNRNFIGLGISWFEELARYCMVYMALLGTEIGLRDGTQITIGVLVDRFKGVPRACLDAIGKLFILIFSGVIFWSSLALLESQISLGQESPGLELPMYVPYAALPVSFGIICLVQGATLLAILASLFSGGAAAKGETA